MYHNIPLRQILLPEIANGNEPGSADIFQSEMMDLMDTLEYVQAYIDDLLCITRGSLEDHLDKLEEVLKRLRDAGLKVNTAKPFFCTHEIEFLGYMLTRGETKP